MRNMMKKIIFMILVLGFAVFAAGCGTEIADTNGPDDYSLAEITEENIISQDMGCSSYSMSPGSESDDYLTTMTKFKGKEFSGVAQLYMTNYIVKSDFGIDVNTLSVDSGNFGLYVLLDGEIVHEFKNNELTETFEMENVKGTMELVMAGESADFKVWIEIW